MTPPGGQKDAATDRQIQDFQRRFGPFDRARQQDAGGLQHDTLSQFFAEYLVIGDKNTYDALLRGMLTEEENGRLETDPAFTKAWRIFVDLCWLKRQFRRAALIVGAVVVLLLVAAVALLTLPQVIGPQR